MGKPAVLVLVILTVLSISNCKKKDPQYTISTTGSNPTLATNPSPNQDPKLECLSKNPFLAILKQKGVTVLNLEEKNQASNKCQEEWTQFNTCCDYDSIVSYANNDALNIQSNITNTQNLLNSISKNFLEKIHMKKIKKARKSLSKSRILKVGALDEFYDILASKELEPFINLIDNLEHKGFNTSMSECWTLIARIRSNSLCGICSGRSQIFFKSGLALVDSDICKQIDQQCYSSFEIMVTFVHGFSRILSTLTQMMGRSSKNCKTKSSIKNMKEIFEQIKSHKVHEAIDNYVKEQNNDLFKAALCEKLLKFSTETMIECFSNNLDAINDISSKALKKLRKTLRGITPGSSNSGSTPSPSQRRLQTIDSIPSTPTTQTVTPTSSDTIFPSVPQNLFTNDMGMVKKNVDSSYTSYIGALGTGLNMPVLIGSQPLPIDVSTAFP